MRRRAVSVWPALADLMTVLAVVGLFLALSLIPLLKDKGELLSELHDLLDESEDLQRQLTEQKKANTRLQNQLQEAVRNQRMFDAIQQAQKLVDEISSDQDLRFSADQTLQFGDDLVEFDLNRYDVHWKPGGKERLRRFCRQLNDRLQEISRTGHDAYKLFSIHVEGHTDSTQCPGDSHCNWWLSSMRATEFATLMRNKQNCPGGARLVLRPIGFADTRPYSPHDGSPPRAVRRIALKIIPDYSRILSWQGRN